MKQRQELLLKLRLDINQKIAAGYDVEFRERRVFYYVLRRENNHLANAGVYRIAFFSSGKKLRQPFGGYVGGYVAAKKTFPGFFYSVAVEIGREYLQRDIFFGLKGFERLLKDYGHGIGFFSGRTARYPGSYHASVRAGVEHFGKNFIAERLPHGAVAEKVSYAYKQLLEKQLHFRGVFL